MSTTQITASDINQFICFLLANEEYGIPITQVQEIIRYTALTRVPQSSEFIEGVFNIRGQIIPVVDLRKRFGIEAKETNASTRIVVIEVDQQIIGLIVDAVTEVRMIESTQIAPPPPVGNDIDTGFIDGMGKLEDKLVILLNINKIFKSNEINVLANAMV